MRIDSVSSGERTRNSPNRRDLSWRGCRTTTWNDESYMNILERMAKEGDSPVI